MILFHENECAQLFHSERVYCVRIGWCGEQNQAGGPQENGRSLGVAKSGGLGKTGQDIARGSHDGKAIAATAVFAGVFAS